MTFVLEEVNFKKGTDPVPDT